MSATEIILIFIGLIAVVVGYVMPAGLNGEPELDSETVKRNLDELVRHSLDEAHMTIRGRLDDALEEELLKGERSMERLTNDKMSAISDYADSVLGDIGKNHDEVMFMYDMLNDKHKNLTNLVTDVTKSANEAKQTVQDAELTAKETIESAKNVMADIKAAREELETALLRAREMSGANPEAHAESSMPGMTRIDEEWFAPFTPDVPRVEETGAFRVLRSEEPAEEDARNTRAAEMVANLLGNKVVPISSGKERHEARKEAAAEVSAPRQTFGTLAFATQAEPMTSDKQSLILEMHQMGKSHMAIARELGLGVGEVKLVVDLHGRHRVRR